MKLFIQNFGRWFLLAFALGFILPHLNGAFLKTDLLSSDGAAVYSQGSLEDAIVTYHTRMNAYTNAYLKILLDPTVAPETIRFPDTDGDCEGNASTYCLAVLLNKELTDFQTAMMLRLGDFSDVKNTLQSKTDGPITLEDALAQATTQENQLQEQVLYAEDALDLTLAVYNQIQTVYPVHVELQKFIRNLEVFRDRLASIRKVIDLYPSKFIGATTAQCK